MTKTNNSLAKKAYATPLLVVYGDVREITQGNVSAGQHTDNTSIVNTL